MSRTEYVILNVIAAVLAMLVVTNLVLARQNQRLGERLTRYQTAVNTGRQAEMILNQVKVRIAQGSDQDPDLRKVLQRNDLKVVLMVDGKKKEYP